MLRDATRNSGRFIQESAKKTHRAELDGEPEPHVIPTLGASQLTIGVVKVEVPCDLVRVRLAGIPAISPFLFGRQERDRHPLSGREVRGRDSSNPASDDCSLKGAVDAGTANPEPARNGGSSQFLLISKAPDFGGIDAGLASLVDTARFGLCDSFKLALAPQVGLKLGKHAQHVEERLTGCCCRVHRLLGRS